MSFTRKLLKYALVLAGSSAICFGAQNPTEVISVINGVKITRSEFEQKESSRLLQARYEMYLAEAKALDDLVEKKLLEQEAAKQHLSVDDLLKKEVGSMVKDPTEDQLQFYYEGLGAQANQPFDQVRDKILDHVRQLRTAKARTTYMEKLRANSNVLITLAPPRADFEIGDSPRLGPATAPVTFVEFADYECPYCSKVHPQIMQLQKEFPDKVSIVFKDFPLQMHAHAKKAAEAARCAAAQNKFWEYHSALFENKQLEVPQLKKQAREIAGIDGPRFDKCLDSGEQSAAVAKDLTEGMSLGLNATPSFFVNGHFFTGAVDYNTMRDMVTQQLALNNAGQSATGK